MTCRDYEQAWNDLIDGEAGDGGEMAAASSKGVMGAFHSRPALADFERALLDHADECSDCRHVAARYQALRRAIHAWGPPPAAPAGFTERVVAAIQSPVAAIQAPPAPAWPVPVKTRRGRTWPIVAAMGTAAAILVMALAVMNRAGKDRRWDGGPATSVHRAPAGAGLTGDRDSTSLALNARALNHAVFEATTATWDLARSASEPTARISRQVLDAATGPEPGRERSTALARSEPAGAVVSVPSLDAFAPDTAAAGALLQQVGDHLATGVRPLSDTARHAFGFLLGPVPPKREVPTTTPTQKGA
jgi:hypothetical protein